jgi:Gas vesicle synthesis protein GvpL/GvpF
MTVTDRPGIWVYAIADGGDDLTLPGLAGVAGADVRPAPLGGDGEVRSSPGRSAAALTAVVSDVDLAEFGEDALRSNLEDLDWLAAVARAHHGVIEAVAQLVTVLPMRLATVYANEASMRAELAARQAQLRAALDRLRSRTEWGVKGYVAQPMTAAAGRTGEGDPGAGDAAGSGGAGLAYLRRRRDALSAQRESWRDAADGAQAVHAELARHCAASRLHPPQSPQLSGRKDAMVLNGAYLLDNDHAAEFSAAVAALNDSDPRLRLELTGPWPPYSFAAEEAE